MTEPSAFSECMAAFAASHGLTAPAGEHPAGLEFDAQDRLVRILPDLHDAGRLVIEVDVRLVTLEPVQAVAQALLLMHRFNDQARVSDGWQVTLDDDVLLVWRSQPLAGLGPQDIDARIEEALEVAERVDTIWTLDPGRQEVAPAESANRVFG